MASRFIYLHSDYGSRPFLKLSLSTFTGHLRMIYLAGPLRIPTLLLDLEERPVC
jgi:hypothetical protein